MPWRANSTSAVFRSFSRCSGPLKPPVGRPGRRGVAAGLGGAFTVRAPVLVVPVVATICCAVFLVAIFESSCLTGQGMSPILIAALINFKTECPHGYRYLRRRN